MSYLNSYAEQELRKNKHLFEDDSDPGGTLNESFGVGPFGLQKAGTLSGMNFYSSDKLKQKFIESVQQRKETKPVASALENLTRRGIIIPCYSKKGIISFLGHKMFGSDYDKSIMAFFSPESNRVYMLMDNRVKFFVWTSSKDLAKTLMHEMMHFACYNLKGGFGSFFKSMWLTYYSEFFNLFFESKDIGKSDTKKFLQLVLKNIEWSPAAYSQRFFDGPYTKELNMFARNTGSDPELADEFMDAINLFITNPNRYIQEVYTRGSTPQRIYACLAQAYRILGYKDPDSLFVQEILFPSEVSAITAGEKSIRPHYVAIEKLAKVSLK
jgi:hypothetical protein